MQYRSHPDEFESLFRSGREPEAYFTGSFSEVVTAAPGAAKLDPEPGNASGLFSGNHKTDNSIRRRPNSHAITFISLFIFSVILYFRPYELIPALSSFKSIAFYSGIITLAIFLVTQIITEGNLTARPREINLALLLVLAALLSMPLAIDPGGAWKTFNEIFIKAMMIFIVFVNVVRTERRLKLMLLLALSVSVYLSLWALHDYQYGIFKIGSAENQTLRIAGSIGGLFENSNDLALHLCTMMPIAIVMALAERGLVKRLAFLSIGVLMIAAIVVTFSRGGFIALMAAGAVLARKLGRKSTMLTIATFVIGAVLFVALLPGGYAGRLGTILHSSADVTGSASQRTEVLKRSILVALRYPIFGVGMGNFHYKSVHELETHNAYTQVGSELGLAALVIYIMFLLHPIKRLREIELALFQQKQSSYSYYLSIGLQASLIAFMFGSFFGAVAYQWYVYYLVGYAVVLRKIVYNKDEKRANSLVSMEVKSPDIFTTNADGFETNYNGRAI